jgi:hypothetical protein
MHGDAVGQVRLPGQEVSVRGLRLSRLNRVKALKLLKKLLQPISDVVGCALGGFIRLDPALMQSRASRALK